jgi:hypothetical protein
MIVEQSLVLQEKLSLLNTAERRKQETDQIANTYAQVSQISQHIQRLVNQYKAIGRLLPIEEQQELLNRFDLINEKVSNFAEEFLSNSDQARRLRPFADSHVIPSLDTLRTMWASQVDQEVKNETKIYLLVRNLPDVRSNSAQIDGVLRQLNTIRERPPASDEELIRYQENVDTLRSQIGGIQGLTSAVQIFLEKMSQNSATIADLTPEILDWCREPSRAKHFAIRFAEGI